VVAMCEFVEDHIKVSGRRKRDIEGKNFQKKKRF
jgi:hypothetical protein